jgi:precorrin-2 dehydrogenase/sirohydrochlorin ferrochelatase
MLPITLNPEFIRAGLAGRGDGLARRRALLADAGIVPVKLFEHEAPSASDLAALQVLFVAGLDETASQAIAAAARAAKVLVNVEDKPALCDFHVPAVARRGDLLLTVSTGGRSPGLAKAIREDLERRFGPEWEARAAELAALRERLRGEGASPAEISERTRASIVARGWLA